MCSVVMCVIIRRLRLLTRFLFYFSGAHLDLPVPTQSFPTRRSTDLSLSLTDLPGLVMNRLILRKGIGTRACRGTDRNWAPQSGGLPTGKVCMVKTVLFESQFPTITRLVMVNAADTPSRAERGAWP